jgi:hypothetical protein
MEPIRPWLALLLAGCATARTHELSRAQHEKAMANEERAATQLKQASAGLPLIQRDWCSPNRTHVDTAFCWTSVANPKGTYLRDIERHRLAAAEHRAASEALRKAEERACQGVDPQDRDQSPFSQVEDIVAVEPLPLALGAASSGLTVVLRPVGGLTPERLQRVLDCHLARNASLGHDVPEMPYCPLVPRNVHARAFASPAGVAVGVWSEHPDSARELTARIHALGTAR